MPHAIDIIAIAQRAIGLPYVLGAEADLQSDELPAAFDCSELVQWACHRAGITDCPDGHWIQIEWATRHGLQINVDEGIGTFGALLFQYDGTPSGHVAFSLGNGMTVEARGRAWGCGSWPAHGRFNRAALIPGVDYSPLQLPPPPTEPEDPAMLHLVVVDDPQFPITTTPGVHLVYTGDTVSWIRSGEALGLLARGEVREVRCTVAEVQALLRSIPAVGPSPSSVNSAIAW
jgi:cell wall-associated NlpC family hydrolase